MCERTFRSKWMNPDFRRDPKTTRYCLICQRDLSEGQPHRHLMYELDRYEAIHPDDWEIAEQQIKASRALHLRDVAVIVGLVGMDCAKRLGLEWTKPDA